MKRVMLVALLMAGFATVFTGCKKEKALSEKLDKGINTTKNDEYSPEAVTAIDEKVTKEAEKAAEEISDDLKKKLEERTK